MIELLVVLATAMTGPAAGTETAACIKTTIGSSGRTSNSKLVVSSGNKSQDQGALQFLRGLDFARLPMGVQLGQTGHILVRSTGRDTYTVDVTDARLLEACPVRPPADAQPVNQAEAASGLGSS